MQLVAMVPHPPLLVPALAAGRAAELAGLLAACDSAALELVTRAPRVVVCLGGGERTTRHPRIAWGTLAGYGADVAAGPSAGVAPAAVPRLPLSLTVGRWLLERVGWSGEVVCQEIATTADPEACWAAGRRLSGEVAGEHGPESAWLVLGDSGRSDTADTADTADSGSAAVRAFESGEPESLMDVGAEADGRAAWQALAGAVTVAGVRPRPERVRFDAAPYGVRYTVATWWLPG